MPKVALATLACLLSAEAAQARQWVISVGAKTEASPPYEGADHDVISPSPTFSIHPAQQYHRFSPPGDGTTIELIDTRYFQLGPMARFRKSRGASGRLAGFDKVQWAAEPGGFVNIWLGDWIRVRGELRRGIQGHQGWVADAGADLVYSGGKWDFSVGPRVGFGDAKYTETYFGVTPLEAARSPYVDAPYEPGKTRRYTGILAGAAYRLDKHWTTTASAGYQRIADHLARSPVIQVAGERDQYSASIGLKYSFTVGH
ncbi:MAG: MipA/OmpV family protein [Caulobacteraceae bacterium]